jgi:hypothetical protein
VAAVSATLVNDALVQKSATGCCPCSVNSIYRVFALNAAFGAFRILIFLRHVPSIRLQVEGPSQRVRRSTPSARRDAPEVSKRRWGLHIVSTRGRITDN